MPVFEGTLESWEVSTEDYISVGIDKIFGIKPEYRQIYPKVCQRSFYGSLRRKVTCKYYEGASCPFIAIVHAIDDKRELERYKHGKLGILLQWLRRRNFDTEPIKRFYDGVRSS